MTSQIKGIIAGAVIGAGLVLASEGELKEFVGMSAAFGALGYATSSLFSYLSNYEK